MGSKRKNDAEFAVVWSQERQRLVRLAFLVGGDAVRAPDVVAEVAAKALVRWRAGHIDDLDRYLRRAVINEVSGEWRRRSSERKGTARGGTESRPGGVEEVVEREAMWAALKKLPAPQRAVLVLRFYEDLTESQTAVVLGVSVGTVKSRCSRGLDRLREHLTSIEVIDRARS